MNCHLKDCVYDTLITTQINKLRSVERSEKERIISMKRKREREIEWNRVRERLAAAVAESSKIRDSVPNTLTCFLIARNQRDF